MDVAAIREEIPALARTIYLNTGGTGPSPRRVTDAVVEAYRFLEEHGPDAGPVRTRVHEQAEAARHRLAAFVGADPGELAFTRSVSEGINLVAWGLRWAPGDEVIVTDQEHPTGLLPWYTLRDRLGVVVRTLPLGPDADGLLDRLRALLTPRTRLLALSHVTAENGLRLPAGEIAALARAAGVRVLFDGAQALGQFPVDLHALGADFYAATGHKWLLAGYGVGFFYVRRALLDEVAVSWTGAGATEHLDRETGRLRWRDGARRFEFGNRLWPSYVGYGVAVETLQAIGPDRIAARSTGLAAALKRELATIPGVDVLSPDDPARSTGIVCFRVAGHTGEEVARSLWERTRIVCRAAFGGSAIRISVAFFTTEDELAALRAAVGDLARGRSA
jgi:selenocysteine lyase/cysteine desulfurase